MFAHRQARGCHLLGLEKYPDLASQHERFTSLGWQHHAAWDMNEVYRFYLPLEETRRSVTEPALRARRIVRGCQP